MALAIAISQLPGKPKALCSSCWSCFYLSALQALFFGSKKEAVFDSFQQLRMPMGTSKSLSQLLSGEVNLQKYKTKWRSNKYNTQEHASKFQVTNVAWLIFKEVLFVLAGFSTKWNIKISWVFLSWHLHFLILLQWVLSEILQIKLIGWMGLHAISSGIMKRCCRFLIWEP